MGRHRFAEGERGGQVVGVILQRLFHRLAHGLQAGKVHDAVDGVSLKDAVQSGLIPDVRLVIGQGLSGDLLNSLESLGAAVHEVISHHDLHPLFQKLYAGMAADIAGAASYEYCHDDSSLRCMRGLSHPHSVSG